jgi:hypothetical protein
MKKLTKEEFVLKANIIHRKKYDYSISEYINNRVKITIICPEHGEFKQNPSSHLCGRGCKKCSFTNVNTDIFVNKTKLVHGDKYDYSKVIYKEAKSKIKILCSLHGEFEQKPNTHLNGSGCKKCYFEKQSKIQRSSTNIFVNKAKLLHGDKYDYSKVDYIKNNIPVKIICPEHGEFNQQPHHHLKKCGCPKCGNIRIGLYGINNSRGWSLTKWIEKINKNGKLKPKLYFIKCFNSNEIFYKIGITTRTINQRFCNKTLMPYTFEIIKEYDNDGDKIFKLEIELKKKYSSFRYTPKIKFSGMGECFNLNDEQILEIINNNFYE